jgi:hypothetical protein
MFRNIVLYTIWIAMLQIALPCLSVASAPASPKITKRQVIKKIKQEIKRVKKERKFKINLYWGYYIIFFLLFALAGGLAFTLLWTLFQGTWFTWFLIGGILGAIVGVFWMIRGGLGF